LPVIQALLKSAQSGEGFQRYAWNKPSSGQVTDKLAYVVMLDRWGWMLGTGIYLEDVERATQQAAEVAQGIRKTMMAIAVVALVAVLFVFATGMTLNVSEHRLADKKLQRLTQRIVSLQEEEDHGFPANCTMASVRCWSRSSFSSNWPAMFWRTDRTKAWAFERRH
jgi:two-component system NarL family sensor kinase